MTPARSRVLAKTLFTIFVALLVAEVALEVAARTGPRPPTSSLLGDLGFTITFALFSSSARRRPSISSSSVWLRNAL